MATVVHPQGVFTGGARVRAHTALHVTISDAPLGVDRNRGDFHLFPKISRDFQRGSRACHGAGHVGAHEAGIHVDVERGGSCGEARLAAERTDRVRRAHIGTFAAARAGSEERRFRKRPGWPRVLARRKLVRDRVDSLAEYTAEAGGEEGSAVYGVRHRSRNIRLAGPFAPHGGRLAAGPAPNGLHQFPLPPRLFPRPDACRL